MTATRLLRTGILHCSSGSGVVGVHARILRAPLVVRSRLASQPPSMFTAANPSSLCRRGFSTGGGGPTRSSAGGPVTWASLAVTLVMMGGLGTYYQSEKERMAQVQRSTVTKVTGVGKPSLGGQWTLVDSNGEVKTDKDYLGKFHIIYFGFTHCPDICPNELVKVGNVIRRLAKKDVLDLEVLFISVDPHRDNLAQLKFYGEDFHPNMQWLTGTNEQIEDVTKAYRVYFSKADEDEDDDEDYLVDHSIVLYLVNPKGEFEEFYTKSRTEDEVVTSVTNIVTNYTAESMAQ